MSIDRKDLKNTILAVAEESSLLSGYSTKDIEEFADELIDRMREEFDCVNESGDEE